MNSQGQIIHIVDDDPSLLRALARRLAAAGFRVETFGSATEFLLQRRPYAIGCVVMDLHMPGLNGLDLQGLLAVEGCALPVVFLSGQGDIPSSVRAMKQGAVDFLTKPVQGEALIEAVQRALEQDRQQRSLRLKADNMRGRYASLTPREREVFARIVQGLLNKQIAAELGTTERTVKAHRAQVMAKMRVQSVAELTRLAERMGI